MAETNSLSLKIKGECHMFTWTDYIMLLVKPLIIFKKTILFKMETWQYIYIAILKIVV